MSIAERLADAITRHDIDALVACFSDDYANHTPAHPTRAFVGSAQVRANWTHILSGTTDLKAVLVDSVTSGDQVWAEWDWHGRRRLDDQPFAMRGVTILQLDATGDRVRAARFYMEPVQETDTAPVAAAVRQAVGTPPSGRP